MEEVLPCVMGQVRSPVSIRAFSSMFQILDMSGTAKDRVTSGLIFGAVRKFSLLDEHTRERIRRD